jgi:acyl-coenzyme A synthetase/AMP-(fatty) acid ligase
MLQIKSSLTMMGYLNAAYNVTDDGWYITGDMAEEKDGWIRVIGRRSDLIKVAGLSLHPSEVEDVIVAMSDVVDVIVSSEENAIIGTTVVATVQIRPEVMGTNSPAEWRQKIRAYCLSHLLTYKVPGKIVVQSEILYGERFKKPRFISP